LESTFAVLIDQDVSVEWKLGFKACFVLSLWLFGCIVLRDVYTSSIYADITAIVDPDDKTTLEDILNSTKIELLFARGDISYIDDIALNEKQTFIHYYYPFLLQRTPNALECELEFRSNKKQGPLDSFLKRLQKMQDVHCWYFSKKVNKPLQRILGKNLKGLQ